MTSTSTLSSTSTSNLPLLTIIIPTCNRNDLLALCLQRLQPGSQTLDATLYEVIVSDDSPNFEAEDLVKQQFLWASYTPGPKRGPAANRNNGARLAAGQWLVFTDDDCLPDANWLQAYADAIEQHPNSKAFEGSILPDDWALLKKDMAECPVNTAGGCFWSANIMVEKKLYGEVGGFDEQFIIAAQEDQDLQWRLASFTTISFTDTAVIVHPVRITNLKNKINGIESSVLNWQIFQSKHYSTIRNWRKIEIYKHLKLSLFNLLKLKPKKSIYHLAVVRYFIKNSLTHGTA